MAQRVDSLTVGADVQKEWADYIAQHQEAELNQIIATEHLKPGPTRRFIDIAFRDGAVPTTGTDITLILPPTSRFSGHDNRLFPDEGVAHVARRAGASVAERAEVATGATRLSRPPNTIRGQ